MGCCNFIGQTQELVKEESLEINEVHENISFTDLSLCSKAEGCKESLRTEDMNSSHIFRVRSTSCSGLRASSNLEYAFLMTTPLNATGAVSHSYNYKINDTVSETSLSYVQATTCN